MGHTDDKEVALETLGVILRAKLHRVPSHLRSIRAISAVESTKTWDLPLHTESRVLSPKYDMDAYMATLLGGEAWDLC